MADVKPLSRAERTRQNRERMLTSARDLFLEVGYAETTMAEIAKRAGVAVQTMYYSFGTKGQLLIETVGYVAAGDDADARPVMQREWIREALATTSGRRALELLIENGTAIYRRVAPLAQVIQAGTSDPDVAAFWAGTNSGRKAGMSQVVAHLNDIGVLTTSVQRGTDVLFSLHSHETYRSLVLDSGWPEDEYRAWVLDLLVTQLLRPEAGAAEDGDRPRRSS